MVAGTQTSAQNLERFSTSHSRMSCSTLIPAEPGRETGVILRDPPALLSTDADRAGPRCYSVVPTEACVPSPYAGELGTQFAQGPRQTVRPPRGVWPVTEVKGNM